MTFVVSGNRKEDLRTVTGLLFSAFPGITVYEYMDADAAADCVRTHQVSALFIDGAWDAAGGFRLLRSLRQAGCTLPIYVFAGTDQYEEDALWYEATGYLIGPDDAQALKEAVLAAAAGLFA